MKNIFKWVLALMVMFMCTTVFGSTSQKKDTVRSGIREQVEITYMSQLHVRELTGRNDGVEVENYLASANFGKGYAWCAAFVNWVYTQHGVPTPKSPAWSPSWFPSDRLIPKHHAQKGDAMGIYFKSKKRIAHVGIIHKWPPDKDYCITVEGNTNRAGSREGDGVYVKRRLKRQIYKVANWINNLPNIIKNNQKTAYENNDIEGQNIYVYNSFVHRHSHRFSWGLPICTVRKQYRKSTKCFC